MASRRIKQKPDRQGGCFPTRNETGTLPNGRVSDLIIDTAEELTINRLNQILLRRAQYPGVPQPTQRVA